MPLTSIGRQQRANLDSTTTTGASAEAKDWPDVSQVVEHILAFSRNPATGLFRCRCSCGWLLVGTESEVRMRASCHDLWEDVA